MTEPGTSFRPVELRRAFGFFFSFLLFFFILSTQTLVEIRSGGLWRITKTEKAQGRKGLIV